jgi:transposase
MPNAEIEVLSVQSAAEKQRMVEETYKPGVTLPQVARDHGVSSSQLFRSCKLASAAALKAVGADGAVVPASEVYSLQHHVKETPWM